MFAIQALERIEYVHSKNYLHRDIKPGNFLVGNPDKSQIYLIDFGNAKKFRSSKTGKLLSNNERRRIYGTALFLSFNVLTKGETTRKDELESLGLLFIYLHQGFLPWSNIKVKSPRDAVKYIVSIRQNISLEELCSKMPREMYEYMNYINKLNFVNKPNYSFLRSLFLNILGKIGEKNDLMFSWIDKNITPNKIKSIRKSKTLQKIYNNILLSDSTKKNISQTSNKKKLNQEQILDKNQNTIDLNVNIIKENMNSKDEQINIKNNTEVNEIINLNKKTINSEQESSNILNKKGYIEKPLKNNNFMKINNIKNNERKNKLIKAKEKSNSINLNSNKNNSLLNENKRRYMISQKLPENLNNQFSKIIKKKINTNKNDLKLNKYIFDKENPKNINVFNRNQKFININNINKNLIQSNNNTYITLIKNVDAKNLDIFNRNKTYFLTDFSQQNGKTQNTFDLSYRPRFYKSIFTGESLHNLNPKNDAGKLIKKNKINVKKKYSYKKIGKFNTNLVLGRNLINPIDSINHFQNNSKFQYYKTHFYKGTSQTSNNRIEKTKNVLSIYLK